MAYSRDRDRPMSDAEIMRRARRDNQRAAVTDMLYQRARSLRPIAACAVLLIVLNRNTGSSRVIIPALWLAGYALFLGTLRLLRDWYN